MPVYDIHDQSGVAFDLLIVAVFGPVDTIVEHLTACGVPLDRMRSLQPSARPDTSSIVIDAAQ